MIVKRFIGEEATFELPPRTEGKQGMVSSYTHFPPCIAKDYPMEMWLVLLNINGGTQHGKSLSTSLTYLLFVFVDPAPILLIKNLQTPMVQEEEY